MAKKSEKSKQPQSAQQALENIDRVFHEKARLGILTAMVTSPDGMNFNDLKDVCCLTDGNLNRHLKVLIDAKIMSVKKSGQGRNTNSTYKLTAGGSRAFQNYIDSLEAVVRQAQQANPKIGNSKLRLTDSPNRKR